MEPEGRRCRSDSARGARRRPNSNGRRLPVRCRAASTDEEPAMPAIFRIALLAAAVAVVGGCDRRTEEVVVTPPPIQPEPVYNKF